MDDVTDVNAVQHAEFALLRAPGDGQAHWYTAIHQGQPFTFRVLDREDSSEGEAGIPVDAVQYMAERVNNMHSHVEAGCLEAAAELAYRSIAVEVSLLEDPLAVPMDAQRDEDCVVDLWAPLFVALMTAHQTATQAILLFHAEHAVDALRCMANTVAGSHAGRVATATAPTLPDSFDSQDRLQFLSEHGEAPGVSRHAGQVGAGVLECQVRRELGGAVVLLGHLDGRTRVPNASVSRVSRGQSPDTDASAASPPPPQLQVPLLPNSSVIERAGDGEEEEGDGGALFRDGGEAYCLSNILTALRPLLQSVAFEMEQSDGQQQRGKHVVPSPAQTATDLVREYCRHLGLLASRPSVLVEDGIVFELCRHGNVTLLMRVMEVFESYLTPILRGQTLLLDRSNSSSSLPSPKMCSHNPPTPLGNALSSDSPAVLSLSRDNDGVPSAVNSTHVGNVTRQAHGAAAAAAAPLKPFWWSCPPQQVHRLTFLAVWLGCREAAEESSTSGPRRRVLDIVHENRSLMSTMRRLQECPIAAQKLNAMVWSGHLVTLSKLLSRDCSLEDYIDYVETAGYASLPSVRGFPGLFLSVLVAGVMAASLLREPGALQELRHKVEALLADVPGRTSPVRVYVMGRPATHTERFTELWLDGEGCGANGDVRDAVRPLKFRSRIELLYYAVVERVLQAAEEVWASVADDVEDRAPMSADEKAGAAHSVSLPSEVCQREAEAALYHWLLMWHHFFLKLLERSTQRRSASLCNATDAPSTSTGTLPSTAVLTSPVKGHGSTDELLSEDTSEVTVAIQQVCGAFAERLETGQAPLPSMHKLLFPGNICEGDDGATAVANVDDERPVPSLEDDFAAAQRAFAATAHKENNEVKLKFYALFKQATAGDVTGDRPGLFDFAGRAKWDAWAKVKGMSQRDAKSLYVSEYKVMVGQRRLRTP